MSNAKHEADDDPKTCPPGMKLDPNSNKCIPEGEAFSEDANAGDSTSVGAGTVDSANDTPNTNPHECPTGSSWDGEKCVPNGDSAGNMSGADAPNVDGKESISTKSLEKILGQYAGFYANSLEHLKSHEQKMLESMAQRMGIRKLTTKVEAFGIKSSKVGLAGGSSVYDETVVKPAQFFESSKQGTGADSGFYSWTISPEAYFQTLKKGYINYGNNQATVPIGETKSEAFTITGGDMPQVFSKQVYLIPGGRMRVPIRQFLDTQIIEDSDRFNWYKVNGFAFDDATAEGSAATDEAQTITKVTATPSLKRASQTVNYSDIENAPFDLIESFNRAAALGALAAEATEVLDTTYDAITPSNWVNANTGGAISSDDVSGMTLKQEGVYAAKRLIENQGGDTSPGSLVLFAHPKAVEELILDTAADFFTGQNALHSTALGVLENRLGVDIVVTNSVAAQDNTTNDTYRNILAQKGSLGLAVAADLQIEAQRRPDLSAVKVGARHRIKGAVIDETVTARISSAQ